MGDRRGFFAFKNEETEDTEEEIEDKGITWSWFFTVQGSTIVGAILGIVLGRYIIEYCSMMFF